MSSSVIGLYLPKGFWVTTTSAKTSTVAVAHMDQQTMGNGTETCATCHGAGGDLGVDIVHKIR